MIKERMQCRLLEASSAIGENVKETPVNEGAGRLRDLASAEVCASAREDKFKKSAWKFAKYLAKRTVRLILALILIYLFLYIYHSTISSGIYR